MLDTVSWVVHPLAGVTLAFLASVIFSARRREGRPMLLVLGAVLLLSMLGAGWIVHPAAGMTVALLASTLFHAWRSEWRTVLGAVLALLLFSLLGAGWAIFPLLGLGLAWLLKVVFSGELFQGAHPKQVAAFPAAATPRALPGHGGGEVFQMVGVQERVAERIERRAQRKVAKLERRAEKLGVPLRVNLEKAPPPAPSVAPAEATGLLALSRDERLPADARARLGALHFRCREARTYLGAQENVAETGPGFLLGQIETDYAPEAVQAYFKLPPSLANVTPLQGGKTGQQLLQEQLDLLLTEVQNIMQGAAQAGSQHLLAHQRFLKERFARQEDELKL